MKCKKDENSYWKTKFILAHLNIRKIVYVPNVPNEHETKGKVQQRDEERKVIENVSRMAQHLINMRIWNKVKQHVKGYDIRH